MTDAIYEFMIYVGIVHHRYFRRLNIAAGDLAKMYRFATIRDKELRDKLTPDYDFGCKRRHSRPVTTRLSPPNVHLETDGIDRIETDGVVDRKGRQDIDRHPRAGNGLRPLGSTSRPSDHRPWGRDLGKWWRSTRFQAYQGVTVPYFPNLISLAGPYTDSWG